MIYFYFIFTPRLSAFSCEKCEHTIQINTSKVIPDTKHRDINIGVQLRTSVSDSERSTYLILFSCDNVITSFLGTHLAGTGRTGVAKMFGVMNIPPSVKEDHYEEIDRKLLLACIKQFQHETMLTAICMNFVKKMQ